METTAQRCDFRSGDFIDKKYWVEKSLGEGSFGKVFKVKDSSGKIYALKLLKLWEVHPDIRQQLVARFDMEFETGRINSNYLVQSVAHGLVGGNPYIVMEYCPNGNLLQLVNSSGNVDWIKITTEILFGLKDLHRYGKVHRDLKPENVLFKDDRTAALTDFGIAGDRNKRLTEKRIWGSPAQIFGTYAYMPPEQVMANRDATVLPTTDIFSFGVMLYFMLTGKLPFGRLENEIDLGNYIKNGREENWDKATLMNNPNGKLFYDAISGCLKSDFKKRLQTVDEVLKFIPANSTGSSYRAPENMADFQHEIKTGLLLRIMQGEEYKKVYRLNDLLTGKNRILTVGRNDGETVNRISILENQSCYISRMHCTLELDSLTKKWYIRDGQWDKNSEQGWRTSTNGTFVNSAEVSKDGMSLSPGDIISIGDLKFRVEGY